MSFIETEGFGLNWLTLSGIILTLINAWQFSAFVKQGRVIWKKKSADSVSMIFAVFVPEQVL